MAREKTTITIDRSKVADAVALTGARSTSAVIDIALERLILAERLRRDVAAYAAAPQGLEETALTELPVAFDLDDDDIDYDAIYGSS